LRVFHLVKGLGRGGAETLLVRTAESSFETGRRSGYGYFLPWKDALVPELEAKGCLVRCFSARNPLEMLQRLPQLVLFLRDWRPDIIHCHLPLAGVIGRLAGSILNVPVVYTEHNLQERYHVLTRLANRVTWTMQSKVIAVSREVEDSIARSLPPRTPVKTVLNGVDCATFVPRPDLGKEMRALLGVSQSDFLIGTVAVFRKQKRLDLWLEVAYKLSQEFPEVRFLLVGDGPERPVVEGLIARYGLSSRVVLPGLIDEVLPYISAMDIFFMSSDFEGLPIALLEAMACGLPAVATRAGGIGEVIRGPGQGLLSEKGDTATLVAHLTSLYRDRQMLNRIGDCGRQRVREAFSLKQMTGQIQEVYTELCGGKRRQESLEAPEGYVIDYDVQPAEALELMKVSLGKGSERAPRTIEFFRWKHLANPFGRSYALGLREQADSSLTALRLFQRWSLTHGEERLSSVRAVDTSTHPGHQRRGLFSFLTRTGLRDLASEGVDLVFNTPNKNSLPGYLKMGWELVCFLPVRARLLSPFNTRNGKHVPLDWDSLIARYSAERISRFVNFTSCSHKIQIDKSLEYLKWRYTGHPSIAYSFQVLEKDSELKAFAIWCETSRGRFRELAICEVFGTRSADIVELLQNVFVGTDCHYSVVCFFNSPDVDQALDSLGFYSVPTKNIALAALPLTEFAKSAVQLRNWVLTTGDVQVF
jgi:L-malate glycosyltransferase